MLFTYSAAIACLLYFAFILFLLIGLGKIKTTRKQFHPGVSVIVSAKDEAANLQNCLSALTNQDYPAHLYEIIIVNDRSTDATEQIIDQFKVSNPNIKKINIHQTPVGVSHKKFALSEGIANSTGEIIFTTDADCFPPKTWISGIAPLFENNTGMVIGLAPFFDTGSFLNKMLCLENWAAAIVSAGAAGWQIGVTCTGRNLAYRKTVYNEVNGFEKINHSISGDDDLFLQLVTKQTKWQIACSLEAATAVPSEAPATIRKYIQQRRRHVSAGKYYARSIQAAYLLFNFANLMLFGFLITTLVNGQQQKLALLLFLIKVLLDFFVLFPIARIYKKSKMLLYLPLWEFFSLINLVIISPFGFIGKIKWK